MGASRREIRRGDLLNVDPGLNRAGYHGDMARTYAVGELLDGVERLAGICRELQDVALDAIRPGVTASSVYDATRKAAVRLGVEDNFQGGGPYIGHGIGLELDEPPVLGPGDETPLEPATGGRLGHLLLGWSRSSPFGPEHRCRSAAGAAGGPLARPGPAPGW